jgi:hypothetical protein
MAFSLKQLASDLRRLPTTVAARVTEKAAPSLTDVANRTFEASTSPDGVPWAPGADGKKVTLVKSGALRKFLRYVGIGTKLRVALSVPYAKWQIGRRPVFPRQGAPLPSEYVQALQKATSQAIREALGEQ